MSIPERELRKNKPRKAKFILKDTPKHRDLSATLSKILQLPEDSVSARVIMKRIEEGFVPKRMDAVKSYLNLGDLEFSRYTNISKRTLARRKSARLTSTESDRVYRLAKLAALSSELFEGERMAANNWLKSPNKGLGGETPLEYAETNPGYDEVVQLIGQLEHGVF